jgi:translation elongation factor EF-4
LDEIIIKIPPRLIENIQQKYIRNFCIIAHIDHGKSTLSDRLLEYCGALNKKLQKSEAQFLDTLKVERERGITVKAQTASMLYKYENEDYLYNLIDTPVQNK